MGKQKERVNIIDSRRWCNAFTCRNFNCKHHPKSIPQKYRNTASRYVDSSNFDECGRWEDIKARKEKRNENDNS